MMTPENAVIQDQIAALLAQLGPVDYQARVYAERATQLRAEIAKLESFAPLAGKIAAAMSRATDFATQYDAAAGDTAPQAVAPSAPKPTPKKAAPKKAAPVAAKRSRGRPKKAAETPAPDVEPALTGKPNGSYERSADSFL